MRILLVQPTTKYPDRRPLRSRTRWLMGITLPYIAGLTPKEHQVDIADDRLGPIPYDRLYDLVGITATCATSERAFEIAREFRQRGVPVVMGGFHVTLHPDAGTSSDRIGSPEGEQAYYVTATKYVDRLRIAPYTSLHYSEWDSEWKLPFGVAAAMRRQA